MNDILRTVFKNKVYVLLACIVLLSAVIRLYKVGNIPISLYWDEVSTGYNAYSISKTGNDEYGNKMPLLFKAFNDYKMPVNVYLTAVSIKIFGINEFAVRLPSALFGILTVFISFFFVKEIFNKRSVKFAFLDPVKVGLVVSFLLSISPWHIQFSRGGFEANIALFFIVAGMYLFFKSFSRQYLIVVSFISFLLAAYSYRSVLLFIPLVILGFIITYRKQFFPVNLRWFFVGSVVSIILMAPLVIALSGEGASRFNQTSIQQEVNVRSLELFQKGEEFNRKIIFAKVFVEGYLSSYSPEFLFLQGDSNGRHSARGMGLLYLWELPFIFIGLYVVIRKTNLKIASIITICLVSSPIASALSIPTPHALRTLHLLPIPQIITALGLFYVYYLLPKNTKKFFTLLMAGVVVVFFLYFVNLYNISNTKTTVSQWGDGYKQLVTYINSHQEYDTAIVSGHYWQPYMYVLFHTAFDPSAYQQEGDSEKFDKYFFGGTSWDLDVGRKELNNVDLKGLSKGKTLIALSPEEFRDQMTNILEIDRIYDSNGKLVFVMGVLK